MMRFLFSRFLASAALFAVSAPFFAQQPTAGEQGTKPRPEETEVWEPVPKIVTPGATSGAAP